MNRKKMALSCKQLKPAAFAALLIHVACLVSHSMWAHAEAGSLPALSDEQRWKRGCFLNNNGDACLEYADYVMENYQDYRAAQVAIQYGCKTGNKDCCDNIKEGEVVRDQIRAKCDAGDADSCFAYAHGMQKIENQPAKVREYTLKGCKLRYHLRCANWGCRPSFWSKGGNCAANWG